MPILPSGARVLQGEEATGELADLAWALDTDDAGAIETFDLTLDAGTTIARHGHTGPLAAKVVAGRMTIGLDLGEVELSAGDVVGLPARLVHVESVPPDAPCVLLVARVGPIETFDA
ncbi:MAG TPA: cupin domain-containing protein [Actinomycetota bacterium]